MAGSRLHSNSFMATATGSVADTRSDAVNTVDGAPRDSCSADGTPQRQLQTDLAALCAPS
jgi:hypothetical protein